MFYIAAKCLDRLHWFYTWIWSPVFQNFQSAHSVYSGFCEEGKLTLVEGEDKFSETVYACFTSYPKQIKKTNLSELFG